MLSSDRAAVLNGKRLRRKMTLPEVLLWQELQKRPSGLKFRRQHAAGDYVLDFFCHEAALCIEVDGIAHDMGNNPEHDEKRDAWLNAMEVQVLRLPASLVLSDMNAAMEAIMAATKSSP